MPSYLIVHSQRGGANVERFVQPPTIDVGGTQTLLDWGDVTFEVPVGDHSVTVSVDEVGGGRVGAVLTVRVLPETGTRLTFDVPETTSMAAGVRVDGQWPADAAMAYYAARDARVPVGTAAAGAGGVQVPEPGTDAVVPDPVDAAVVQAPSVADAAVLPSPAPSPSVPAVGPRVGSSGSVPLVTQPSSTPTFGDVQGSVVEPGLQSESGASVPSAPEVVADARPGQATGVEAPAASPPPADESAIHTATSAPTTDGDGSPAAASAPISGVHQRPAFAATVQPTSAQPISVQPIAGPPVVLPGAPTQAQAQATTAPTPAPPTQSPFASAAAPPSQALPPLAPQQAMPPQSLQHRPVAPQPFQQPATPQPLPPPVVQPAPQQIPQPQLPQQQPGPQQIPQPQLPQRQLPQQQPWPPVRPVPPQPPVGPPPGSMPPSFGQGAPGGMPPQSFQGFVAPAVHKDVYGRDRADGDRSVPAIPTPGQFDDFARAERERAERAALPPQGWHADPFRRADARWFDGERWTPSVLRQGRREHDPL